MKKLQLSTHESASNEDSFRFWLVTTGSVFVLIFGLFFFNLRIPTSDVQAGVFPFESGTQRSTVLKVLGGPTKSYSYDVNRVDNEWVGDDGVSANTFVRAHLPNRIHVYNAWQWGSCLVFFNNSDEVVFWCRVAPPPKD